ncbi:hypothetical protein BDQ17DRAFT_1322213 [Cyathus striatus]|nr:hypothetical protein BDQ17DRAFT_1322213 [Cyathus striatus]
MSIPPQTPHKLSNVPPFMKGTPVLLGVKNKFSRGHNDFIDELSEIYLGVDTKVTIDEVRRVTPTTGYVPDNQVLSAEHAVYKVTYTTTRTRIWRNLPHAAPVIEIPHKDLIPIARDVPIDVSFNLRTITTLEKKVEYAVHIANSKSKRAYSQLERGTRIKIVGPGHTEKSKRQVRPGTKSRKVDTLLYPQDSFLVSHPEEYGVTWTSTEWISHKDLKRVASLVQG